ncbi:hypothetical protein HLH36_02590 [Gluconacetobacter aggeris]|uniref:Uncharacterized protein n=1 Tax=Gluconacetobacter aggeris TaxID=1286186 RepID=A0A7W4IQT3_9PROT|nr:hypothetical protein [Gluconacetobacter aggeris]MBB2167254.1 hypothetical protein [Gluconacetobacter aggeris]
MKKLTLRRYKWLKKRQLRMARKKAPRFVFIVGRSGVGQGKAVRKDVMPRVLCFDRNCSNTLSVLSKIRRSLQGVSKLSRKIRERKLKRRGGVTGYWPFETVKYIGISSALVLAAEYERWHTITNTNMIVIDPHKWHPSVFICLREMGFFDNFKLPLGKPIISSSEDLRIIRMKSGSTADPVAVAGLISELKSMNLSESDNFKDGMIPLYGAMIEGIMNVVRHAYPKDIELGFENIGKWWMTGAVSQSMRRMSVAIFDQGVTIPRSLPAWDKYSLWKENMKRRIGMAPAANDRNFDGIAIWAAVEESVSSTGDLHRGLGLAQMRSFIDGCSSGYLRIISRNGEVTFRPGDVPVAMNYDHSLDGTLIEWSVGF